MNTGPYIGHLANWQYVFDVLKPEAVCAIEQNDPTSIETYNKMYAWIQEVLPSSKGKFKAITYTNDASQNPIPAVTAAKQAGCDLITLSTVAPNAVAFMKAAQAVGLDATFMNLGSAYDASVPGALGKLGEAGGLGPKSKGFFVGAELADVDAPHPKIKEMMGQFAKDGTPANFWSQIGWLSAALFVDGLKQDPKADLTTSAGVLAALKAMKPYDSGLAATPLVVGPDAKHSPNRGVQMLTLKDGKWAIAAGPERGRLHLDPEDARLPVGRKSELSRFSNGGARSPLAVVGSWRVCCQSVPHFSLATRCAMGPGHKAQDDKCSKCRTT